MKRFLMVLCTGLLFVTASAVALESTSNVFEPPIKDVLPPGPPSGTPDTGGETIATATVIPSLPYSDGDNTCGHTQDYVASCAANAAPDLFYVYNPATTSNVIISLCGSGYDTALYVLENGVEIACNDDFCGLQSELAVTFTAGRTYHIGVSGFSTSCGSYVMNITELVPCIPSCPPGVQVEGEPVCGTDYVDNYNGGCNSTPNIFQPVECGTICGETGTYLFQGGSYRDTDWYSITVGAGTFNYSGIGDGYTLRLFVGTIGDCVNYLSTTTAPSCVQSSNLTFNGPGSFWLWAGPDVFSGVPCGSKYILTLTGPGIPDCGATAVEPSTWGNVKAFYR